MKRNYIYRPIPKRYPYYNGWADLLRVTALLLLLTSFFLLWLNLVMRNIYHY